MEYDQIPAMPEFSPAAARARTCQLLRTKISASTFRRWRRSTGLNGGWMTEREVWMISVYGRCISLYRNSEKAIEKANELIEKMEKKNEQSAA